MKEVLECNQEGSVCIGGSYGETRKNRGDNCGLAGEQWAICIAMSQGPGDSNNKKKRVSLGTPTQWTG